MISKKYLPILFCSAFLSLTSPCFGSAFDETDVEKLYAQALKLRDHKIEGLSPEESENQAWALFQEVCKAVDKNPDPQNFKGRASHNIGVILYGRGDIQAAAKFFVIAANSGLKASRNNILKIKEKLPAPFGPDETRAQEIEAEIKALEEIRPMARMAQIASHMPARPQETPEQAQMLRLFGKLEEKITFFKALAHKARTQGFSGGDIDLYYYELLKDKPYGDDEIRASLFTQETLDENHHVAEEVHKFCEEGMLPIFVGRSVEWILEHYKRAFPEAPCLHLPGSGLSNLNRIDSSLKFIISNEEQVAYTSFLVHKRLGEKELKEDGFRSIVLFDRTETGDSLFSLTSLITGINPTLKLKETLKLLGMVPKGFKGNFNFPVIEVGGALGQTASKHHKNQDKILSRAFDSQHWPQWQTFEFYPKPLPPAQARLEQVIAYYSKD